MIEIKSQALGAGIGFRDAISADIYRHADEIDFVEIVADHFLNGDKRREATLDLLCEHFVVIPHALNLSLGSAEGLDEAYLEKLATLVARINPPWWSEHIAFTRAGGVEIGHLTPLPFAQESIDAMARNVEMAREMIGPPLILENISYAMEIPGGTMTEPEFVRRVLDATDCGLLLDVANLHANAMNHGGSAEKALAALPLERVVQMHFAGGNWLGEEWVDSHATATAPAVWELLETAVKMSGVRGILLERDEGYPPFGELLGELCRARDIGRRCGRWN